MAAPSSTVPAAATTNDNKFLALIREALAGVATAVVIASEAAILVQEVPIIGNVCSTFLRLEQLVETARSNKDDLHTLRDLCEVVVENVLDKRKDRSGLLKGFVALDKHVKKAEAVAALCNEGGIQGALNRSILARKICKDIAAVKGDILAFCTANNFVLTSDLQHRVQVALSKSDEILAEMERALEEQRQLSAAASRADVPPGAPRLRHWYVEREAVISKTCHLLGIGSSAFDVFGEPRMVGLAGPSGAGKSTVASMVVAREDVRAHFHKGVIWLSVGQRASDRLPSLMFDLATTVWETVLKQTVMRPRMANVHINSEDGAAYIREVLVDNDSRHFLVVADNVWDVEVLRELKRAGVWVLFTTRQTKLLPEAPEVRLDEVLTKEAEMVLRRAAELDDKTRLPEAAYELITRCDSIVLDLVLVGRWGVVRYTSDERAWRTALDKIVATQQQGDGGKRLSWRAAVLRAGLAELTWDNPRNKELYLSLALLPTELAFPSEAAAALLYGDSFGPEGVRVAQLVLNELERWSIVTLEVDGKYRVHEDHSDFVWGCLAKNHDVRDTALLRWRKYISSRRALDTYTSRWLVKIWSVLSRAEGKDVERRPYEAALLGLDYRGEEFQRTLKKTARFHFEREDWPDAYALYSRLRQMEEDAEGADSLAVADVMHKLGMCANNIAGREEETEKLLRQAEAIQRVKLGPVDPVVADTLHSLGVFLRKAGRTAEAEPLLRQSLAIRRKNESDDPLSFARVLYSLGVCVYRMGRLEEAERELLRPALDIRRSRLGSGHPEVGNALYHLGVCVHRGGRTEEGEGFLHEALEIFERKQGKDHRDVGDTLDALGVCAFEAGRTDEADVLFQRALAIREQERLAQPLKVSSNLDALGECTSQAGGTKLVELCRAKGLQDKNHGVAFTFEATVCSGIPMIVAPEGSHHGEKILQVCGFMEDTTSFLLSKTGVAGGGAGFGEVLQQGQDMRYAEADLRKLLKELMYGADLSPESIQCSGVFPSLASVDLGYASRFDSTMKLLGTAMISPDGGKLSVIVSPVLVSLKYLTEPCAGNPGRIVCVDSEAKEWETEVGIAAVFYVRFTCKDAPGILKQVGQLVEECGVSMHAIKQTPIEDLGSADFAFTTHPCTRSQIDRLSSTFGKEDWVRGVPLVLPFLL